MSSPKPLESRQSVAGCIASFTEAVRPDEPRRVPRDIKDRRIGTGTRRIPGALRVTSHDPHHDTTRIRPRPTDRVAKFPGAHRPVTKASVRPANKLRQNMR